MMVSKRDDDFDSDDEDEPRSTINFSLSIIGIVFLILTQTFLYLLSEKTSSHFGLKQIVFGLIIAIVITLFLAWVRWIMFSNKYAGIFISILAIMAMFYALTRKYSGPYTLTFGIIGAILILCYIIIQFVKLGKK